MSEQIKFENTAEELTRDNIKFEDVLRQYEDIHGKVEIPTEQSKDLFKTLHSNEVNSLEHIIKAVHANLDKKTGAVADLDKEREKNSEAVKDMNEKKEQENKAFVEKYNLGEKLSGLSEQEKEKVLKNLKEFASKKNLKTMDDRDLEIIRNTMIEKIDAAI